MFGLYDRHGILRFVDSDKEVCIAYAELFELGNANYCLIDLTENKNILEDATLVLNQAKNNS